MEDKCQAKKRPSWAPEKAKGVVRSRKCGLVCFMRFPPGYRQCFQIKSVAQPVTVLVGAMHGTKHNLKSWFAVCTCVHLNMYPLCVERERERGEDELSCEFRWRVREGRR